jgi:uncharacterized membrane protein
MESRAKLFGHPIHQMLIVFPLGLLAMSVIFDVLRLALGWSIGVTTHQMIGAGVIAGLLAAVFGLIDWLAIPAGTRAKSVGLWHAGSNVATLLLFAISWWLRRPDPANPSLSALALSALGAGVAVVGGWLGGELVSRLGVGVDDGANVNAPSSLSGGPAGDVTRGFGEPALGSSRRR